MSTTYNANANLKARGVEVEYTQEQISEYIRCAKDPVYFINTYVKIINLDKGLTHFKLFPYQERLIRAMHENRFVIVKCFRQAGKALDLEEEIKTSNGFKKIGDLQIGDLVYAPDGTLTPVVDMEEFEDRPCFEITFDTGEKIIADAAHEWEVERNKMWGLKSRTMTTEELFSLQTTIKPKQAPLRTPVAKPIQYPERQLKIHPYVLGLWLGDGHSYSATMHASPDDDAFYCTRYEEIDQPYANCYPDNNGNSRRTITGLHRFLRESNLLQNKHIPVEYMESSFDQRLELLRGLMDTDGSISNGLEWYQKNPRLIREFRDLLASMGIKSRQREKIINGEKYFTVAFWTSHIVFSLPRKIERQQELLEGRPRHPKTDFHYIHSIVPVERRRTKCISVLHASHMFLAGRQLIPTHNSITTTSFILHQILFTPEITCAILANKERIARELLERLKLAYEHLPKWLQQGVVEWNKTSIVLENNSKVLAAATSSDGIRGLSINILMLDEFAFLPPGLANKFFTSVYPTIASGQNSKIIITSTPNGMNLFYNIWNQSISGQNQYKNFSIHWSDWPGRDEQWKQDTIAGLGGDIKKFQQEFECEFLGSANTLISDAKIASLVALTPISSREGLDIYEKPEENRVYIMCVDLSEGVSGDYHAITVMDVTSFPYKVVAKWRDNTMSALRVPDVILAIAKVYNEAFVLIESNKNGGECARTLHDDLEYENILMTSRKPGSGQQVGGGFGGRVRLGVEMDKNIKRIGCVNLKALIESDKLIVNDHDIIEEFKRFVSKGSSYEAETGNHDDLTMTLVMFAWLINQRYFKDLMDQDIQAALRADQDRLVEEDLLPFGFFDDGRLPGPPPERFVV